MVPSCSTPSTDFGPVKIMPMYENGSERTVSFSYYSLTSTKYVVSSSRSYAPALFLWQRPLER